MNSVTEAFYKLCGVKQRITFAYHPQANGLVERMNRTIQSRLLKVLGENENDWELAIEGVQFSINMTEHASTGYSPYELMYGKKPLLPIDVFYIIF